MTEPRTRRAARTSAASADAIDDATDGAPPESYAAAEAELEEILTALEGEGVDVDQLSGHVQRAKALITWCRAQVASAEVTITELLADGDGGPTDAGIPGAPASQTPAAADALDLDDGG